MGGAVLGFSLELTEALMIRAYGEFDIGSWVRGATIPLPSTVAGALGHAGWLMDAGCSKGLGRWDAMRECIASLLKKHGLVGEGVSGQCVTLRGPLAVIDGRLFVGCAEGLAEVSPEGISEWVARQESGEVPGKRAGDVAHELIKPESFLRERTCVGLMRGWKTARMVSGGRGLLYTAPYVYGYVGRWAASEEGRGRLERIEFMSLAVDIAIGCGQAETAPQQGANPIPLRLGGEDRKAIAMPTPRPKILSALEDMWGGRKGGEALLVLATPLVMKRDLTENMGKAPITPEAVKEAVIKEVEETLEGEARLKRKEIFSIHSRVRPRITPLQLGYDERKNMKDQIRPALMPGAVFTAEIHGNWRTIYLKGAGNQNKIGFGTLIPIPKTPQKTTKT